MIFLKLLKSSNSKISHSATQVQFFCRKDEDERESPFFPQSRKLNGISLIVKNSGIITAEERERESEKENRSRIFIFPKTNLLAWGLYFGLFSRLDFIKTTFLEIFKCVSWN
jgi:hypothetical protein